MKTFYTQITLSMFLLLFYDTGYGQNDPFGYLPFLQISDKQYDYTFEVGTQLPKYRISVFLDYPMEGDHPSPKIIKLEIRNEGSSRILQRINLTDAQTVLPFDCNGIYSMDLNFDGYEDLFFQSMPSGSGSGTYSVWLFDPKARKFKYNAAFSELENIAVDWKTQTVSSSGQSGAAYYYKNIYKVKNDSLMLERGEENQFDDGIKKWLKTTKLYSADKLVVKVDTINDH
jgi:hypothetical protein